MILREEYSREAEAIAGINWREGLAQRKEINPAEWAQEERWIAQGASPLSQTSAIRYDVSRMPFCEEPMIEAVNPEVQVLVLDFASGMAKTEICVNVIGFKIERSPANIFVVYPKDESAKKFSRDVLQRSLIDATPAVMRCVVESKSRDAGNTIGYKRFLGGSIYITAARSASNFRGPRAGVVYCDEIDGFPASAGEEGDPISLAFRRAEGFPDSIKLLSGTPTLKNHSAIENWLDRSDKRMWLVPCRRCDRHQVLVWRRHSTIKELQAVVDWPAQGRNRHEKAVILCGHCAVSHNDPQRLRAIFDGHWKPTQLFNGIRGYWLNGLNSTLPPEKGFKSKLHQFAVNAHDAIHSANKRETTKVWVNTFLAETYQEETDVKTPWSTLFSRREEYPTIETCRKS